MATSAIGPGFSLKQRRLHTPFSEFLICYLLSILLDIGVQLNIWRIIAVSKKKAQDIANEVLLEQVIFWLC